MPKVQPYNLVNLGILRNKEIRLTEYHRYNRNAKFLAKNLYLVWFLFGDRVPAIFGRIHCS